MMVWAVVPARVGVFALHVRTFGFVMLWPCWLVIVPRSSGINSGTYPQSPVRGSGRGTCGGNPMSANQRARRRSTVNARAHPQSPVPMPMMMGAHEYTLHAQGTVSPLMIWRARPVRRRSLLL